MGFFLYTETLVFAYIFTLTNGLQVVNLSLLFIKFFESLFMPLFGLKGVTIMLFRCFLNDEVRTAIKDRWKRHRNNRVNITVMLN